MSWYSIYGTGATIYGVERREGGRVQFTSWISVLWVPIVPLSSWSAVYAGERPPNGITDTAECFADLRRIPHDWGRNARTFAAGVLTALCAVAPSAIMIARTNGRGATKVEMVVVFASIIWPVALVLWIERHRQRRLRGE